MTPPALERAVERCLEKDPDERWQSAHDLHKELEWIAEDGLRKSVSSVKARRFPFALTGAIGILCLVAGLLFGFLRPSPPPADPTVSRLFTHVRPAEELGDWGSGPPTARARPLTRTALAFSPDGTQLVFVGRRDDVQQLYIRSIDQYEARSLPETEVAMLPFFSPDEEWVGFFAERQLKKVPITGGSALTLCDLPAPYRTPFGATWTQDETVIYAGFNGGLMEVSAAGGSPKTLTTVDTDRGEFSHRFPQALPERRAVLFTIKNFILGG